jgi:hypothetical protein
VHEELMKKGNNMISAWGTGVQPTLTAADSIKNEITFWVTHRRSMTLRIQGASNMEPTTVTIIAAGMTLSGAIFGALMSQIPHFFLHRSEKIKHIELQRERWETSSLKLSEEILSAAYEIENKSMGIALAVNRRSNPKAIPGAGGRSGAAEEVRSSRNDAQELIQQMEKYIGRLSLYIEPVDLATADRLLTHCHLLLARSLHGTFRDTPDIMSFERQHTLFREIREDFRLCVRRRFERSTSP